VANASNGLQEYEKRLLAKDQEVKSAQLALRRLEAELHSARAEVREAAAAAAHMLPAPEPKQGAPCPLMGGSQLRQRACLQGLG